MCSCIGCVILIPTLEAKSSRRINVRMSVMKSATALRDEDYVDVPQDRTKDRTAGSGQWTLDTGHDRTGRDRTGQAATQDRTEQDRIAQTRKDRTGQDRTRQERTEQDSTKRTGQGTAGGDSAEGRTGQDKTGIIEMFQYWG